MGAYPPYVPNEYWLKGEVRRLEQEVAEARRLARVAEALTPRVKAIESGVPWGSVTGKPLAYPPLPINYALYNPAAPYSDYPMGSSLAFVEPAAGWPHPSYYGTLVTHRSYSAGGGTIQYWSSYQSGEKRVFYRIWFYQATAWGPWTALSVEGHTHDDRYYTESEIDAKLVAGAETDFLQIEPTKWSGPVGSRLTIPTHVTPEGGQTTHPSVLFFPDGWNGYRYWMAHTPYPAGNDDHEDPNLAVSNDGVTWIAAPGVTQPLDNADGTPEYNSDTDLVMGPNGVMHLFWRFYDSSLASNQEKVYVRTSTDGATWTAKTLVWQYTETSLRPLSPSFTWDGTRWTVYAVDITPATPRLIRMQTTGAALSGWSAATTVSVSAVPSGWVPWHVEVRRVYGQWIGLLLIIPAGAGGADGYLMLMTSISGTAFTSGGAPLIPQVQAGEHDQLYRASAVPEFIDGVLGLRVWYSAFLDGPPAVWNIYRTFVALDSLTHVERGSGALGSILADTGGATFNLTFTRPFATVPDVSVTTDSGRLHCAVLSVSKTGFSFRVENYTAANASGNYRWVARS